MNLKEINETLSKQDQHDSQESMDSVTILGTDNVNTRSELSFDGEINSDSKTTSNDEISSISNVNNNINNKLNQSKRGKVKLHSRTPSYNKMTTVNRPNLNRSKSTDGVVRIKRNNRSFTKIANLQPLTKTLSNQSLKSNKSNTSLKNLNISLSHGGLKLSAKQGRAILRLNDDNEDYEDMEDEGMEEEQEHEKVHNNYQQQQHQLQHQQLDEATELLDVPLQQVFQKALGQYVSEPEVTKYKSQSPQPELYTEKPQRPPYGHVQSDPIQRLPATMVSKNDDGIQSALRSRSPETETSEEEEIEQAREQTKLSKVTQVTQVTPQVSQVSQDSDSQQQQPPSSQVSDKSSGKPPSSSDRLRTLQSSTEDFATSNNLYGGSLFLSQSTGLIRKIDPKQSEYNNNNSNNNANGNGNIGEPESFNEVDSNGGISFKANPIDLNVSEPVVVGKPVIKENSYQPNQTIFNNLQRTNTQYVNSKKQLQQQKNVIEEDSKSTNPTTTTATATTKPENGKKRAPPQNIQIKDLGVTDFANFLNSGSTTYNSNSLNDNNDNRTQQRLWLQRENSLMDVSMDPNQLGNFSSLSLNKLMFAHNYNQSNNNLNHAGSGGPQTPMSGSHFLGMTPLNPPDMNGQNQNQNQNQQSQNHPMGGVGGYNNQVHGGGLPVTTPGQGSNQAVNVTVTSVNNSSNTSGSNSQATTPNFNNENSVSTTNINGLLYMIQNGQNNPVQSRIEFERLNREYLNVRRYLNPIGQSLNRVKNNTISIKKLNDKPNNNESANTFEEFSPNFHKKDEEITNTLNKIWQEALMQTLSMKSMYSSNNSNSNFSANNNANNANNNNTSFHSPSLQRPQISRLPSQNRYMNLRSPQVPTTRAVKLAAQAAANRQ